MTTVKSLRKGVEQAGGWRASQNQSIRLQLLRKQSGALKNGTTGDPKNLQLNEYRQR